MRKRLDLEKIYFILYSNRVPIRERKTTQNLPQSPSFWHAQPHSLVPDSSTPSFQAVQGMGAEVSPQQLFFSLLHLHSFLLQGDSFPWATALQDQPAPVWALHGPWLLQGMSACQSVVLSMGCSVDACSSVISCREDLCLDTWTISSSDFGVCRAVFHTLPALLTSHAAFCPFSHGVFLRHCHCGCRVQPCLVVSPVECAELAVLSLGQSPPLLTRATLQPPTSTLNIASTTVSVQLRMGTKADPISMEYQEKPVTSHTKLTGKIVTMPQSGSLWFSMEQDLCILSEYNQAAVDSQTVSIDARSPPGVQANCSLHSLCLEKNNSRSLRSSMTIKANTHQWWRFPKHQGQESHILVNQSGPLTKNLVMQFSSHMVEGKKYCVQQMKPMLLNATRL